MIKKGVVVVNLLFRFGKIGEKWLRCSGFAFAPES
jgi:hypothetical protein